MKRKIQLVIAMLTLMTITVSARKVTQAEAYRTAVTFLSKQHKHNVKAKLLAIPKQFRSQSFTNGDDAPFYVYNAENNKGFVIVSGDDAIGNIIGYSNRGSFYIENAPSNVTAMLNMYAIAVENVSKRNINKEIVIPEQGNPIVSPLLKNIEWGQDAPFNNMCPTYTTSEGTTKHYYVGCVATAMAQIMRFWGAPTRGKGVHSYNSTAGMLTANFGETTYQWDKMPERVEKDNGNEEQNNALATLCAHLGISVNMTYEPNGSGALSSVVTGALVRYFNYDPSMSYKKREHFSTTEWMEMIKKELNEGRPIYYSASNEDGLGGHAFVCDGYDDNDFIHINWGWYGRSNGYFLVNALNPETLGIGANGGGYNLGQEIIVGIKPVGEIPGEKEWAIYASTRIAISEYNGLYTLMAFIGNYDSDDFKGDIAALLTDGKNILKVLKYQPETFKGVDPTIENSIDAKPIKIRDFETTVPEITDGNYRIMFGYRAEGQERFTIIRQENTLPNYIEATVKDGVITKMIQHVPHPDAQLLSPITTDGALYAKGSGVFRLDIRNNSEDFYLGKMRIRFTDINDNNNTYILSEKDTLSSYRIYDKSEKTIYLLIDLPENMPAGKYRATVFENKHEDYPFKHCEEGEDIIEVQAETTVPVIRQTSAYKWICGDTYDNNICQGQILLVTSGVRNYGAAGTAGLILKLADTADENKVYDFMQINNYFDKLGAFDIKYYKRLDVEPGEYRLLSCYKTEQGELPVESAFEPCIISVKHNADIPAVCEEFILPKEMEKGKRIKNCSLTIKANRDLKNGTLYLRIRQRTNDNGELIFMKSGITLEAGNTMKFDYDYTPKIEKGEYIPTLEFKSSYNGNIVTQTIGNYHKYYSIITVSDPTDITELTSNNIEYFTICDNNLTIANTNKVNKVEVYALDGTCRYATKNITRNISLPLCNGIYILRMATASGPVIRKFAVK